MKQKQGAKPSKEYLTALESEIPRLRRFALSLTGNRSEADDLVQDCLCRAIEKSVQWKPGTNLRAWLFTIQRNLFLTDIRRQKRISDASPDLRQHSRENTPGAQVDTIFADQVEEVLNSLPYEQREVVLLVGIEGMTYEEVATVVGVPIGTVRSRLSRAREALRAATNLNTSYRVRELY